MVINKVQHYDAELIGLLLDDKELKQYLPKLSDKNQFYVNFSSLNDKDFTVLAEEN